MTRPVIIDCDPGVDDCLALMLAFASPEALDVLGVCTVAGNVPVEVCTRNACAVRELAGREDVPVHAGCARPLAASPVFAGHIHGEDGLGGAGLPEPSRGPEAEHAVHFLIDTLRAARDGQPLTLVLTGPMTNLAAALVMAPDIAASIGRIVIMGGAREAGGNITASAEFNIYADPHAAAAVLACGRPITLIGLDATLQFRCSSARMERLAELGNRAGEASCAMISHVNQVYGEIYGDEGAALHDPCTVGFLLRPDLFTTRPALVQVETSPGLTRGHAAVDLRPGGADAPNADWAVELKSEALFDLLLERLGRL